MRVLRLIGVELNRLASRRLTLVAVLVVLALLGLVQLAVNETLSASGPQAIAAQRQAYESELRDWQEHHAEREAACRADGTSQEDCAEARPDEADYDLEPITFADLAGSSLQGVAYLGGIAVFLIAASFIGAEFTSGAIGNWLSFVPRRDEVYASKLAAAVLGSAVIGAGLGALTIAATAVLAGAHGVPVTEVGQAIGAAGRATAAIVVFAVLGFVVALIGRHTVVALGALLAYGVVTYIRALLFSDADWTERLTPLLPEMNLVALIMNGFPYYLPGSDIEQRITTTGSAIYLLVFSAAVAVVGWLIFRRRDVN